MQPQVTNLRYRRMWTVADGHIICGEKHRTADDSAWKFGHAAAGYKPALPEGVDGCGRAHNLWRKVLDCTRFCGEISRIADDFA